jgi:hypothetical protein
MNNKELIKLAALSIGLTFDNKNQKIREDKFPEVESLWTYRGESVHNTGWNPLVSSSDAFELMIVLGIENPNTKDIIEARFLITSVAAEIQMA